MLDDLLPYYEKELSHLRFLGQEFAQQYPKIASRLLIEGDNCEDPHTERLIEAFSFLAARVHKKLDDEFPEIVEAFLEVLYPHYLRPTPSRRAGQGDRGLPGGAPHRTAFHTCRGRGVQVPYVLPRGAVAGGSERRIVRGVGALGVQRP